MHGMPIRCSRESEDLDRSRVPVVKGRNGKLTEWGESWQICLFQFRKQLAGGVLAGAAGDAAPRIGSGSAQEQSGHGRAISRPSKHRTHREERIERRFSVVNVSASQSIGPLEIDRRQDL